MFHSKLDPPPAEYHDPFAPLPRRSPRARKQDVDLVEESDEESSEEEGEEADESGFRILGTKKAFVPVLPPFPPSPTLSPLSSSSSRITHLKESRAIYLVVS